MQLCRCLQEQQDHPITYLHACNSSEDEVEKFRLHQNDVVITKDSETWDDIGVPALVTEPSNDLISGYHLAILRPRADTLGPFLFWALQSKPISYQFHVEAKGVTRYGLAHNGIQSVSLPVPPLEEQAAIVRYLDNTDQQIKRYIAGKERLIALLEEERQALVHQAVTRGLAPNVKLKDSGVEWLGYVPEHWEIMRARFLLNEVDIRSATGTETHLSMSQVLGLVPGNLVEQSLISNSYAGGKLVEEGDLVLNRLKAHLGVFALAKQSGVISPEYSVFRKRHLMSMKYFEQVFRLPVLRTELRIRAKGIVEGFWRLYTNDLFDIRMPVPSFTEQQVIVDYLDKTTAITDAGIARARQQIELIEEYRTRLIADVVTGKIDVREVAERLPELKYEDRTAEQQTLSLTQRST